jgi:hypothetical protein
VVVLLLALQVRTATGHAYSQEIHALRHRRGKPSADQVHQRQIAFAPHIAENELAILCRWRDGLARPLGRPFSWFFLFHAASVPVAPAPLGRVGVRRLACWR